MAVSVDMLRKHLRIDGSMEDAMLFFYLETAKKYVKNATGTEADHLVLIVASIFYEYRVSEEEMSKAFDALTPFFVQEAMTNGATTD
ncbi:phage gp6-like head-tail connector protein [Anoxybacillus flavithermus]|uniref:head-tail connector protein n=2 Tax=Anoxybacillus flavithermus TaxID=33934 RepID=UPI001866B9BB|nr:head-tail connector protein [Anoxybacillus flavithermus]MBE2912715.1 phage gp6-like head-tail connector protein [Anoxybacillus flavithermus]MBE2918734.1 phage gp6-like head-tail connector protein [Anoxybacillus flavithermus]